MTYGWSILIVAIALVVLFELGVFNGSSFLSTSCIAAPGYACANPLIYNTGAVMINFMQNTGSAMTITGLECSSDSSPNGVLYSVGGINKVPEGGQVNLTFECPSYSDNLGSSVKGSLWIQYEQNGQSGNLGEVGTFTGSVKQVGTIGNMWFTNPNGWVYGPLLEQVSYFGRDINNYLISTGAIAVAVNANGNVWVAGGLYNVISEISSNGVTLGTFNTGNYPDALAIDANGNIWVANYESNTVSEFSNIGTTIGTYPVGNGPIGIAIDPNQNIWVANYESNSVTELSNTGSILNTYYTGNNPESIAVDSNENIWVANYGSNTVSEISNNGANINTYSVGSYPLLVAIGLNNSVWIGNYGTDTVTELTNKGNIVGVYQTQGTGLINSLQIAPNGNVWVATSGGASVTELSSSGTYINTYTIGPKKPR